MVFICSRFSSLIWKPASRACWATASKMVQLFSASCRKYCSQVSPSATPQTWVSMLWVWSRPKYWA